VRITAAPKYRVNIKQLFHNFHYTLRKMTGDRNAGCDFVHICL